jgi:chromosome segregation ATPase
VQFFNEYLTKISQLEGDKESREKQVNKLIQDKEELFLTKFDLERKLEEMSAALKTAETGEKEAAQSIKILQKKYEAKVSECESMLFRLRHMEDMASMLDPPIGMQSSITNLKMTVGAQESMNMLEVPQTGDNFEPHNRKLSVG